MKMCDKIFIQGNGTPTNNKTVLISVLVLRVLNKKKIYVIKSL